MNFLHKIIALIFLAAIAYSIDASAGDDRSVYTEHNGNIDANLTSFILDGSLSVSYTHLTLPTKRIV